MNGFPLIHRKYSNEHLMAGLTLVLLFYLAPRWFESPKSIVVSLVLLIAGLLLDAIINFIRFKAMTCGVSAAVTVLILDIVVPDASLLIKLSGVAFALLLGKHIWGGTGRNKLNPALVGVLFIYLVFQVSLENMLSLDSILLLVPAMLLSVPFIIFRPYASTGLLVGIIIGLLFKQELSLQSFVTSGAVFWSCIVISDPVTITPNRIFGACFGLLCGVGSFAVSDEPIYLVIGVLIVNAVSFILDKMYVTGDMRDKHFKLMKTPGCDASKARFMDLTIQDQATIKTTTNIETIKKEAVLERIENSNVFGFGGAGFPTSEKLKAVIGAEAAIKHFIINGAECDPGLLHDKWLIKNKQSEILKGIELIKKCVDFNTITIALKDKAGFASQDMVKLHVVPDYYPVGAEKKLIQEILGTKLTSAEIPSSKGILVINIQTVYAAYEAVIEGKKADTRYLTVANLKYDDWIVVKAGIDSSIEQIVMAAFANQGPVFAGGGIMNCHISYEGEKLGHTTNFIAVSNIPHYKESPQCSRCGRCVENCPAGLKVFEIAELVDDNKLDKVKKYKPEDCLGCGICSYVCPAGRKLSARCSRAKAV